MRDEERNGSGFLQEFGWKLYFNGSLIGSIQQLERILVQVDFEILVTDVINMGLGLMEIFYIHFSW